MTSPESSFKCSDAPQSSDGGQLKRISIQSISFTEEGETQEGQPAPAGPLTAHAAIQLCRERLLREKGDGSPKLSFEQ